MERMSAVATECATTPCVSSSAAPLCRSPVSSVVGMIGPGSHPIRRYSPLQEWRCALMLVQGQAGRRPQAQTVQQDG